MLTPGKGEFVEHSRFRMFTLFGYQRCVVWVCKTPHYKMALYAALMGSGRPYKLNITI